MNRDHWLLTGLIAVELAVAAYLVTARLREPRPPLPSFLHSDSKTAAEIKMLAGAETPKEWEQLAEIYFSVGYYPEAEACYRRLAQLEPDNARTHFRRAFSLSSIGRPKEANDHYRRAIQLEIGSTSDCWYLIGQNYLRMDDAKNADLALSKSNLIAALYLRAHIAFGLGDVAKSAVLLDQALTRNSRFIEPHLLGQRISETRNQSAKWLSHYDSWRYSKETVPTPMEAQSKRLLNDLGRYGLGKIQGDGLALALDGRWDAAVKRFREALDIEWHYATARRLVEIETRSGAADEALRWLDKILKYDGRHSYLMIMFGNVYARVDRAKARQAYEHSVKLPTHSSNWKAAFRPERHELLKSLAVSFDKEGDAKSRDRYNTLAYEELGVYLIRGGDLQKAAVVLGEAVKQKQPRARSYYYLGEALRRSGVHSDAKNAYQACLKQNPHHGGARGALRRYEIAKTN